MRVSYPELPTTSQTGLSWLAAAAALALPAAALADPASVNWTDWNIPTTYALPNVDIGGTFAPGTTGTVVDPITGETLTLTLSGEIYQASQESGSWEDGYHQSDAFQSGVSPVSPEGQSMLTSTGATPAEYQAHTLLFGRDVTNAVMGLYSLGDPFTQGELTFSQPFIVLSDNAELNSYGDADTGYKLGGNEGGGVLQFLGTYDRLDWVITGTEVWHGFSIGLTEDENPGKDGTYQGEEIQGWSLGEPIEPYDLYASGDVVEPTPYIDPNAPPSDPEPEPASTTPSLLASILGDAEDLSASLSNVSQNLNDIDGSIAVTTERDLAGIAAGINALVGEYDGFGSFSTVNPNVYGVDLPASLLTVLDPLVLELGNLSTTAIGTLQSGNMTGSFDASGIVNKVTSTADGATTGATMLAETYGGIANTVAMQNVSVNSGDINGSVDLILADVDAKVGSVATTAIGALQSGAMTASVDGAIGTVSHNSATLVAALVGGAGG